MPIRAVSRSASLPILIAALVLALAISLTLAARGGPATVRLDGHLARLTLSEFSISPQALSVPAGRLEIVARNSGILPHNLTFERERPNAEGEPVVLSATGPVLPGATVAIWARVSAGRYRMLSTISNQADLGMTGTLVVR